jgi:hypothetical protein
LTLREAQSPASINKGTMMKKLSMFICILNYSFGWLN